MVTMVTIVTIMIVVTIVTIVTNVKIMTNSLCFSDYYDSNECRRDGTLAYVAK